MSKAAWLKLLVTVNIALAGVLILTRTLPRPANAQQSGSLADNYMVITGRIQSDTDAMYIIDTKERTLHTFTFRKGTRELEYGGYRMLERDMRNNRQ